VNLILHGAGSINKVKLKRLGKLAELPLQNIAHYHAAMSDAARTLYLVCYDVAKAKRLHQVHRFLLGYKVGGQKSFFECWLTRGELSTVRRGLLERLNLNEDRAHIFQLDPRQQATCLGTAQPVLTGAFMIL
jgi:CRISPR-associated protein Cas2